MKQIVKLPVWSDEWMFGRTTGEVTSVRGKVAYVRVQGLKRRSKFLVTDLDEANKGVDDDDDSRRRVSRS